METEPKRIAAALDLAVLKPTATRRDVVTAACLVERHGIASLCVAPCNVRAARTCTYRVSAVVGFPHGNAILETKLVELQRAVQHGASEIDAVINYGAFLDGDWYRLATELHCLVGEAHALGAKIKIILETCFYTPEQIVRACKMCVTYKADWVKTSTGLYGGATPGVVKLMLEVIDSRIGVKASGGIKTYADAKQYLDLGCTRIGSSNCEELLP